MKAKMTPRIAEAKYAGDYRIWLRFADGTEGEIDLELQLWGPVFEPLKDKALFARFELYPEHCDHLLAERGRPCT